MSEELKALDSSGLCLLSLDGGGVRGLSTLYILKSIMDRLNAERKEAGSPAVKPCEVFDLIGGTSTGGLIAIMLGRLEMDVDECITAYSILAADVFCEKTRRIPINFKGRITPKFDSSKLEEAIRRTVVQSGASEADLFNDGNKIGCRTFVCTVDYFTKDIVRLRNYKLPDEPNIPATICQAALATSAASTFFEPVSIGDRIFADGGLGANNPVDEVEGEASNIWCSETGELKPLVKLFISIGTGQPAKKAFEDSIFKFLGQTVVQIATETDNTERKFIARWAKHFDEKRYFRFNVNQGLQNIGLDEYKKKGAMEAATTGYLTHGEQKFQLRDCIRNLRLKRNKATTSFAALLHEYSVLSIGSRQDTQKAPWVVPFDRNPHFTGCEEQLAQLESRLFKKDGTAKVAVVGLGGTGKTSLVLELLYRTREKHPNCCIIWIPVINMESTQQAYLHVAKGMSIPGWNDEKANVKRLVQEFLSSERAGKWLLVFDNADDMDMWIPKPRHPFREDSDHLINYLPRSEQGSIIFTTRHKKAAVKLAHQNILELSEMDEDTARELMVKYLLEPDLVKNNPHTDKLLAKLACLPLAIVQAAAFINENDTTLEVYLSILEEQDEEVINLLSEEFEDDGRYSSLNNPVAITWLISLERIRYQDPLAVEFLSFMASIESRDIPQSLLPPGPSKRRETEAVGTLLAYSFISRQSSDHLFSIHRLVYLTTRNWLGKENLLSHWARIAIGRLNDVFPSPYHENRSAWRRYLAHARFTLDSPLVDKYCEIRRYLLFPVGMCLASDARYHDAEIIFKEALELNNYLLGPDNVATLYVKSALGSLSMLLGRWEEAKDIILPVIETQKRVLGPEHPGTLSSMATLASTYMHQGQWKEAETLEVQVLETRKRVFGTNHSDTFKSMGNLALIYTQNGRVKEAEDLEVEALEGRKRVLGPEHPDTLASMHILACTWHQIGRRPESIQLMGDCITLESKTLGPEHPKTLFSAAMLQEWQEECTE